MSRLLLLMALALTGCAMNDTPSTRCPVIQAAQDLRYRAEVCIINTIEP